MSAPAGNQFWKQRSKHGRDKLFSSPDVLWDAACEYFDWCDKNPIIEVVHDKKKVNGIGDEFALIDLPKLRPYTWDGLELFLDVSSFREYKTNEEYKDFFQVISRIEKVIYNQKFTGAATNQFNANIISRDLGLADKTETKSEATVEVIDYSKLSDEALAEIANAQSKSS